MDKQINKKEILKSPVRAWNDIGKTYDAILLIPTGTKHDSGYMHIAVVGVTVKPSTYKRSYEICAYPDDISTFFPKIEVPNVPVSQVRMDCFYPSGILQYHGRGKFYVSQALSSVDITFEPYKK